MNPLTRLPGAARGLALAVTLAGTIDSTPRRDIHADPTSAADWAADPARVGHQPGYTWSEPDGVVRCVHCNFGPCTSPHGHSLSAARRAA